MNENLEAMCPKCGNKEKGPILSPSIETKRIDKNDTTIVVAALLETPTGFENVRHPIPAWGYICGKCGTLFAVSQLARDGTVTHNEMKEMVEEKSEE